MLLSVRTDIVACEEELGPIILFSFTPLFLLLSKIILFLRLFLEKSRFFGVLPLSPPSLCIVARDVRSAHLLAPLPFSGFLFAIWGATGALGSGVFLRSLLWGIYLMPF